MNDPSSLFSSRLGREKHRQAALMVQLLASGSWRHDDDGVLTNDTGTEARPHNQKSALSSALVISRHQCYQGMGALEVLEWGSVP